MCYVDAESESEATVAAAQRTYRAMLVLGVGLLTYSAARFAVAVLPAWAWPVLGWGVAGFVVLAVLSLLGAAHAATLEDLRWRCDEANRRAVDATESAAEAWRAHDVLAERLKAVEGRAEATSRACCDLMRDGDRNEARLGRAEWAAREAILGVRQLAERRGLAVIVNEGPV